MEISYQNGKKQSKDIHQADCSIFTYERINTYEAVYTNCEHTYEVSTIRKSIDMLSGISVHFFISLYE